MMSFQPQHPVALEQLGVDDHTRARAEGQADPRPTDPVPQSGLNGVLMVVAVAPYPTRYYPAESNGEEVDTRNLFNGAQVALTPAAHRAASKLSGLTDVLIPSPIYEASDLSNRNPLTLETLLLTAQESGADLLLIYTSRTDADATDVTLSIGAILTLGFGPTVVVSGEAELQAVLMDSHTGYVYALAEAEGDSLGMSGAWGRESEKMDEAEDAIEEAVDELIDRLEAAWPTMRAAYP